MKDLLRQKIAVDPKVADMLLKQIQMESTSSAAYLAMAGWCDMQGLEKTANFFYKQSDEERGHMLKIYKYLADMGVQPVVAEVSKVEHEFASVKAVFETTLDMELAVTDAIHAIVETCKKVNDHRTQLFLNWFITEQVEEEYVARRALEILELVGEDPRGLYMFDERINSISYSAD